MEIKMEIKKGWDASRKVPPPTNSDSRITIPVTRACS
jgi:hypothetical protein